MKLLSHYAENETFEQRMKKFYSEEIVDIVIEWTDVLRLRFIPTDNYFKFQVGISECWPSDIYEYTDEIVTFVDVISIVTSEMEIVLEDENDNREEIEKELNMLFYESDPIHLKNGTKVRILDKGVRGIIDGFITPSFEYIVIPFQEDLSVNSLYVQADNIEKYDF